MPFFVTRAQSKGTPPLYAARDPDGEILWAASKREATPFAEREADEIAAELGRYGSAEDIEIIGAGASAPPTGA